MVGKNISLTADENGTQQNLSLSSVWRFGDRYGCGVEGEEYRQNQNHNHLVKNSPQSFKKDIENSITSTPRAEERSSSRTDVKRDSNKT